MGRHPLAVGEIHVGEEALVALNQAAFDQGFGKAHGGSSGEGPP